MEAERKLFGKFFRYLNVSLRRNKDDITPPSPVFIPSNQSDLINELSVRVFVRPTTPKWGKKGGKCV
jgi:hypothetical protein